MTRNLVESKSSHYDQEIKKELIDNFDLGWRGNVKARYHSCSLDNKYRDGKDPVFRAQLETYKYYQENEYFSMMT
jgi:polyphosphate kinase